VQRLNTDIVDEGWRAQGIRTALLADRCATREISVRDATHERLARQRKQPTVDAAL
jgi:hypothetical protein